VNQEAFVYRKQRAHPCTRNIHFPPRAARRAKEATGFAVGARVTAYAGGSTFMQEESPTRGFESSVDYVLALGSTKCDGRFAERRLADGRVSVQRNVAANQLVTVRHRESVPASRPAHRVAREEAAHRRHGRHGARLQRDSSARRRCAIGFSLLSRAP